MKVILKLSILALVVIAGVITFYLQNKSHKKALSDISLKTLECESQKQQVETKVSILETYVILSAQSSGKTVNRHITLTDIKNNKHTMAEILTGKTPRLVFRYSYTDCSSCIDTVFEYLWNLKNKVDPNKLQIIIIPHYTEVRQMIVQNSQSFKNQFTFYMAGESGIGLPIDKNGVPYLCIIDEHKLVRNILVMAEQPAAIQANYELLKTELLKHPGIEAVTSSFQLPGDAIRDVTRIKKESNTDWVTLPIMVAGEDFLPFFRIRLIAGRGFSPAKYSYRAEEAMLLDRFNQQFSGHTEEYIVNRKALSILGFNTPEEAVGEMLQIEQGTIDYFRKGIIVGVTDDFNYTGLYEETIPLLLLQRRLFTSNIMVRVAPGGFRQACETFGKVWNEVNPDYPADYTFMNEVFNSKYHNEMNAQQLVYTFSLLCLIVANLGLIIFMAFIIRRRTREIGIRKIHGASVVEIIRMLNADFIRYIALAFVVAVPVAWYIMQRWLERFAYRTSLDWWIFALAGLSVLLVSLIAVSLQSWRAAAANPVDAIKTE